MVQPAPGPAPEALCGTSPYVSGLRFGAARIAADLIGCGLEEDVRRTRQIKRTAHGGQPALWRQLAAPSRQARGPTTRSSRAVVCAAHRFTRDIRRRTATWSPARPPAPRRAERGDLRSRAHGPTWLARRPTMPITARPCPRCITFDA